MPTHQTAAPHAPLASSDSLLAPLLVGLPGADHSDLLASIVSTVCNVVPAVTVMRKRMEGRKAVAAAFTREVVYRHDGAVNFKMLARCIDRAPGEEPSRSFARWTWEVGFLAFDEGTAPAPLAADYRAYRADVTRFKLKSHGLVGAQQLAMLRHLLADAFTAVDPQAIIVGGQSDWEPAWWPNPAAGP